MQFLINDCSCDLAVHVGVLLPFWSDWQWLVYSCSGRKPSRHWQRKIKFLCIL